MYGWFKVSIILKKLIKKSTYGTYHFWCPGCGTIHSLGDKYKVSWDNKKPTVTPGIYLKIEDRICHSFITGGKIQYLGDCTHILKDRLIPMEGF